MPLVMTKYGEIDERYLTPDHHTIDNERESTRVIQWRLAGEVVHRSAHIRLKQGLGIEGVLGRLG